MVNFVYQVLSSPPGVLAVALALCAPLAAWSGRWITLNGHHRPVWQWWLRRWRAWRMAPAVPVYAPGVAPVADSEPDTDTLPAAGDPAVGTATPGDEPDPVTTLRLPIPAEAAPSRGGFGLTDTTCEFPAIPDEPVADLNRRVDAIGRPLPPWITTNTSEWHAAYWLSVDTSQIPDPGPDYTTRVLGEDWMAEVGS